MAIKPSKVQKASQYRKFDRTFQALLKLTQKRLPTPFALNPELVEGRRVNGTCIAPSRFDRLSTNGALRKSYLCKSLGKIPNSIIRINRIKR